jgi:hypothetical protein
MSSEQKKLLLKARVAVALQNELGRVTKDEEIEQVTRDHNYCKITVEEPQRPCRGFSCYRVFRVSIANLEVSRPGLEPGT